MAVSTRGGLLFWFLMIVSITWLTVAAQLLMYLLSLGCWAPGLSWVGFLILGLSGVLSSTGSVKLVEFQLQYPLYLSLCLGVLQSTHVRDWLVLQTFALWFNPLQRLQNEGIGFGLSVPVGFLHLFCVAFALSCI